MFIKSMEICGFKSYGTRTEIRGFDPYFNAITGLNGSGKSNILDSICFVLGITNLTQVRASNLQDLVYKNGQAGITKASVSITFDNTDPRTSPVGYENVKEITITRIVIIGGRNKYLINGVTATNNRVQDFFQSVQLNVNNPHFLIMQGRITKVLNMKPMEILSMVEEAAGTRMYESKRESSLKLMTKKEERLNEINRILVEEITPTLTRLKEERKDFVEYTKVVREFEHLTKLYTAYQFMEAQQTNLKSKENAKRVQEDLTSTEKKIEDLTQKVNMVTQQIKELERKMDEEAGGRLAVLENDLKTKQMEETKVSNLLKNAKIQLKESKKEMADLTKQLNDEKNLLVKKELEMKKLEERQKKIIATCEEDTKAKEMAMKKLEDANAGLYATSDGESATLAAQLIAAQTEVSKAKSDEGVAQTKLPFLSEDLVKKQAECKGADDAYKRNEVSYKSLEKEVNSLKQSIAKLDFEEGILDRMENENFEIGQEIERLQESLDAAYSRFPQLFFKYADPVKNFDRKKVYGLVCTLFRVRDPVTALALEIAASGRLYNVVVDNDATGKLLLNRGQLNQRWTLIPLNKIVGRRIPKEVVYKAECLVGNNNVCTALSLIEYDIGVNGAMEYVYGGTFVSPRMDPAKRVAFGEGIFRRCVTLDGEVFDPSGTLSGGSMGNRGRILAELVKIRDIEDQLKMKREQHQQLSATLVQMRVVAKKYTSLQETLDVKVNSFNHVKYELESSKFHQQIEEVALLKKTIEEQKAIVAKCKDTVKKAEKKVKDIQSQIDNEKSARERFRKEIETEVEACQKKLSASEHEFQKAKQAIEEMTLEISEIKTNFINYEQQLINVTSAIAEREKMVTEKEAEYKIHKETVGEITEEVKVQKGILRAHSIEIGKHQKEIEAMRKDMDARNLHLQQLKHDVEKSHTESSEAEKNVARYLEHHPWIEEEQKYFGVVKTEYDFTNFDVRSTAIRLKKLDETKTKLSKSVNTRAQNMLQSAEEQYKDLMTKKRVVLNDKEQIQNVIKELDDKKKIALRNACEKVNKDFGSIFSTLLPGAKAKLVPQEGRDVLEGLEFKVGFGDAWKEALTELSGGQRSLVALSLILSLLLFKPAPIYILDEVDAALDLSHTQNIGMMLKKHFAQSQFIVVSLKDGMFNNANVLFKTKFVDGMSTVSRTSLTQGRRI